MILYASSSLFMQPKKWLRGTLVPSSRSGWLLIQAESGGHASMTPEGVFQESSFNDGPYEQCLQRGNNLIFQPRMSGEDQIVPMVEL